MLAIKLSSREEWEEPWEGGGMGESVGGGMGGGVEAGVGGGTGEWDEVFMVRVKGSKAWEEAS